MEQQDGTQNGFESIDIEAVEAADAFAAYGYARLKVQRGDKVQIIKVKVASLKTDELEALRKSAPKPPSKMFTDPNSKQRVMIPDLTDTKYLTLAEEFNRQFTREVVGRGVTAKLTLTDGSVASTPEQVYQALLDRGLSGSQFAELTQTILNLTQWTDEEREKFL